MKKLDTIPADTLPQATWDWYQLAEAAPVARTVIDGDVYIYLTLLDGSRAVYYDGGAGEASIFCADATPDVVADLPPRVARWLKEGAAK